VERDRDADARVDCEIVAAEARFLGEEVMLTVGVEYFAVERRRSRRRGTPGAPSNDSWSLSGDMPPARIELAHEV
jgi:hypothetical protein